MCVHVSGYPKLSSPLSLTEQLTRSIYKKSFIRLMVSEGSLSLYLPYPFGSGMRQSVLSGAVVESLLSHGCWEERQERYRGPTVPNDLIFFH